MSKITSRASWAVVGAALSALALAPAASAATYVVQFRHGVGPGAQRSEVRAAGGQVVRDLHVINGLGVRMRARSAARLAHARGVAAVTANSAVRTSAYDAGRWAYWRPDLLSTAFVQSTRTDKAWTDPNVAATGAGVAVAVVDTGIAGDLPDFRVSQSDPTSRVVASVVTNPDATTATDRYGHGTHVAGLLAGDSKALPDSDPLNNRYMGTAPDANLVSIKASDDHGNSSLIDVIAGVQFAVDHKDDYGIRVLNLSMNSAVPQSYRDDPLDAAVESAWFHGIVVVAAAGNRGTAADAVDYAPANDPYVITVGGVDDHGTKDTLDDTLAPWSSRGTTQDGFAKPELVAPGAHIVGPLAPDSDFATLCPACVVDGRYFRIGGTSMAAPIVAGIAADVISAHPDWTPDQVKGALTYNSGTLEADGEPDANVRPTADGAWEVAADNAVNASNGQLSSNTGLTPNPLVDPASGDIDYTRASWGRASWSTAADALRASWSGASWSCDCSGVSGGALPTRASWSRASWSSFFGDTPSSYGELAGGDSGSASKTGPGPDEGSPKAPAPAVEGGGGAAPAATAPAVAPAAAPPAPVEAHSARHAAAHLKHRAHRKRVARKRPARRAASKRVAGHRPAARPARTRR